MEKNKKKIVSCVLQSSHKVRLSFGWIIEIVMRNETKKFEILPKRWIVERTFSWFESYRRLSKDFEYHTNTQETMIQLAMIKIMIKRIKE